MLESQSWDESTNSQKGLLLEKNARLVQFKIIDNHLSKQSSTTTAHMQRSRLFILGVQWCDQFEQLWQPADTNINATNRRNLPRNRTNPIMKPHLWIEMNENHRGANEWYMCNTQCVEGTNEWPHDYHVDFTARVNWFIHETDQNENRIYISWKEKKIDGKAFDMLKSNATCFLSQAVEKFDWRDHSIHFRRYFHTMFEKARQKI